MPAVTRVEIASHIEAAFSTGPASRDALVACAASSPARPQAIRMLQTLPAQTYPTLRALWTYLSDVPLSVG